MKLVRIVFTCLFIFSVISFQSCENEPLDTDFFSNIDNDDDGGDDGDGGDGEAGESTGDYWPRAIGNMWDFDDSFYGDVTYNMITTEQIDGFTYYKFDDLFNQEAWLRKSGDSYYVRNAVANFPIDGYDVSTTYITIKLLDDSAEVGEEWVSNVSYTVSYTPNVSGLPEIPDINVNTSYSFEMMERDATRMVEGVEYQNVLHVKLTVSSTGIASTVDYFYAKDIGLIEFIGEQSSGKLLSYTLN